MIPDHYYTVICCPQCKSDLETNEEEGLSCQSCKSTYPVVEGIPILLQVEDEVSQVVKQFYDSEWKRNSDGVLRAKVQHEDLSSLGQRYINVNENRFVSLFAPKTDQSFFLDAASGAQPRVEFGDKYTYHVCVDFSLDGLIESRKLLGDRAICICGSLLNMPLKDSVCDSIIASHVLYHIDKDLQDIAVRQLHRVLCPEGEMVIFYGNPHSLECLIVRCVKKLIGRSESGMRGKETRFYYHSHTINYMLGVLRHEFGESRVRVEQLRMFTKTITGKALNSKFLGKTIYKMLMVLEHLFGRRPSSSSYVAYIAKKRA